MSTTVTYKGSTLTTVSNETKKLNTAGTWLEGDITITDSSSGGGSVDRIQIQFYQDADGYLVMSGDDYVINAVGVSF